MCMYVDVNLHMWLYNNIIMEAEPHKAAAVRPPTTNHENYQS